MKTAFLRLILVICITVTIVALWLTGKDDGDSAPVRVSSESLAAPTSVEAGLAAAREAVVPKELSPSTSDARPTEVDDRWLSNVLKSPDYLYAYLPKDAVFEAFLVPSREEFLEYISTRLDRAAQLDIDELLRHLPPEHPFWAEHAGALQALINAQSLGLRVGDVIAIPTDDQLASLWGAVRDKFALAMQWHALRRHISHYAEVDAPVLVDEYFGQNIFDVINRRLPWLQASEFANAMNELQASKLLLQSHAPREALGLTTGRALVPLTIEFNARDREMVDALGDPFSFLATAGVIAGSIELHEFSPEDLRWSR